MTPTLRERRRTGEILSAVLAGSWRPDPLPFAAPEADLASTAAVVLASGAAGLVCRRLTDAKAKPGSALDRFRQAYRFDILNAALLQMRLVESVTTLREHGMEPLLVKGWAVSGYYANRGLRPHVDIDLWVRPEEHAGAADALFPLDEPGPPVDLHAGVSARFDRGLDEIFERSRLLPVAETTVRVPSEEDHFRLLCIHLWGHSAWRPLWLCDIAAVVEGRRRDFDWDLCLRGSARYREWIACAVALARDVLDADMAGTPFEKTRLPSWLVPALLSQWGGCLDRRPAEALRDQVRKHGARPSRLLGELRRHWPDPIEVTFAGGRPVNDVPRVWYQIGAVMKRLPGLSRRED